MANDPLPALDRARCTGCHRCVDVCPTAALAQLAEKAYVRYPERCNYCTACEDVCPTGAISLPFMVVFWEREEKSTQCDQNESG